MTNHEPIVWDDSLLTGVVEIDRQHKILVDMLNDVSAKLEEPRNARHFEQITRDLLAYAIYHFETEEQLIERFDFAGVEGAEATAHIRQHRDFSERVMAMRDDAKHGRGAALDELRTFLKDWLVNHICTSDQRLGRFIRGKMATR